MPKSTHIACLSLIVAIVAGTTCDMARAQQRDPRAFATQPRQPANGAPAATAPGARPAAPPAKSARAPFQLTPVQQQVLFQVLKNYERKTTAIKTFSADLVRLEFDPVFGPKDPKYYRTRAAGKLIYAKPDKARYEVGNVQVYDSATNKYRPDPLAAEFVVVDGKNVIAKNFRKKQVHVTPLPKELQGQGIFYGPLPFVFGAKANDLLRRYFMRITTPEVAAKRGEIWIEAWPRFQADAANYKRVDLIIRAKEMLPIGIQVNSPNGKNRTVYTFANQKVDPYKWNPFSDAFKVSTPFGWKRFVEKPPAPGPRRATNPQQPRR